MKQSTRAAKVASHIQQIINPPAIKHEDVLGEILSKLEPCDFKALAQAQPTDEMKQKHLVVLTISQLLKIVRLHSFALARKGDFVFICNGHYWKEVESATLRDFLGKAAEKLGVTELEAQHYEFRDKLYKQFLSAAHFTQPQPDLNTVLINLRNGTFEVRRDSQSLREFRPSDFLTHQLAFEYDAKATSPIFDKYLSRVLPDKELQDVVAEFFGYIFTRNLKLEKAMLLYGEGANGKSVLFDLMNALIGRENTANFSLSDLLQEHNRALIAHKLLNYGSEINGSTARDVFKNLVSGEPIMARLKYGNSFLMENYAKLCFNANELPQDHERSTAYFRRLLVVPFNVTIPDSEQDKELAQKIIQTELSGVFNWVLAGLRRLLTSRKFTESKLVIEAVEKYKQESDSVGQYLEDLGGELNGLLQEAYSSYRTYCLDAGMKPLGRNNFSKRLAKIGYTVEPTMRGRRVYKEDNP